MPNFNPNLVILDRLHLKVAFAHAISGGEIEVCGLLGGRKRDQLTQINAVIPIINRLGLPDRFESDPDSHFSGLRKLRAMQLEWVGTYHSHPVSTPVPSKWDLEMAQGGGMIDLIIGNINGCWTGRFWDFLFRRPVPLIIEGDQLGPIWEVVT